MSASLHILESDVKDAILNDGSFITNWPSLQQWPRKEGRKKYTSLTKGSTNFLPYFCWACFLFSYLYLPAHMDTSVRRNKGRFICWLQAALHTYLRTVYIELMGWSFKWDRYGSVDLCSWTQIIILLYFTPFFIFSVQTGTCYRMYIRTLRTKNAHLTLHMKASFWKSWNG